ncbi:MFS transporter [Paenibacillus agricola]|uniref:MFS transporter n=1 Tax=Paenibacillus agricola TaxID=2716264 RepID=A0ABX0J216_9BACL|nr:MFS transporter [Paenibacillus agricola]NHN29718.1 MFS transporter [Paenibacillus agricola]
MTDSKLSKDRHRLLASVGLLSIFTSSFVYMLGVHMLRPIMALYFDSVGYAAVMIGFFVSLNAVIPILFGMPIGSWIDRMGTRQAVVTGSLLGLTSATLFLIGSNQENIVLILLGQVINGIGAMFAWGSLQVAASLAANKQANNSKSNHVISNFSFVNSLGQLSGPAIGGFMSDWGGFQLVFYLFAGLNLLGIVLSTLLPGSYASTMKQMATDKLVKVAVKNKASDGTQRSNPKIGRNSNSEDNPVPTKKPSLWRSYGNGYSMMRYNKPFAIAILLNGILFMLIDVRTTFFPLFLSDMGLTNTEIGSMVSVSALAAIIVRPLAGNLMNWLGYHRIMMISIFSGATCLLMLMFQPGYWVLAAIVFVWGVCTSVNQPVALMMVSQTVAPSERGMGMSIRSMSNRFVQLINPVLFGTLTTVIGLTFGFAVMGVVLMGFGIVYHRQSKKRHATEE